MTEEATLPRSERVNSIDMLRGIAIAAMIFQHFLFDTCSIFYTASAASPLRGYFIFCNEFSNSFLMLEVLEPMFRCLFILISGVACRYSRSNLRRGIRLCIIAVLLSLATVLLVVFDEDTFYGCEIYFGILHLLGVSMVLWGLLGKPFDRLCENKTANVAVPLLLVAAFVITYRLGESVYDVPGLFWLGFPSKDFYSADYFPLLPWVFMFFLGAWVGKYIKDRRFPSWFYKIDLPPFSFIGRHTLLVYVIHQPIVFAICYLVYEVIF